MNTIFWLLLLQLALTTPTQDELAWSDEFNYEGKPDSSLWTYDIGHGHNGWGNNEIQYYSDALKNAVVRDGKLIISAIKEPDGTWTSARLKTQGRQHLKYGRVQFRARLPKGSGTWPALWMLGENIAEAGWPACGEIDVMEHVGKEHGMVHHALHMPASYGDTHFKGQRDLGRPDTAYHLYEVEWRPGSLLFRIDGETSYHYQPPKADADHWPFDQPFFLIMNIAMGGNWGSDDSLESNGLQNGIDPQLDTVRMEVDYVRVYK